MPQIGRARTLSNRSLHFRRTRQRPSEGVTAADVVRTVAGRILIGFIQCLCLGAAAAAQEDPAKVEIIVHASPFRFVDFNPGDEFVREQFPDLAPQTASWINVGVGSTITYSLSRLISSDVDVTYFPNGAVQDGANYRGGHKLQVVLGPRLSVPLGRIRAFVALRPGFIRFSDFPSLARVTVIDGGTSVLTATVADSAATFFVINGVAGIETKVYKRIIARLDTGDSRISFRQRQPPNDGAPSFVRHNLQVTLGCGIRF